MNLMYEKRNSIALNSYEFSIKLQQPTNLFKKLGRLTLSSVVSKKGRYVESGVVKLNTLFTNLCNEYPKLKITQSFVTIKGSSEGYLFLYLFLIRYLKETGRYTLSPISIKNSQFDFVFQDYNFLANFLKVPYDFFGWKYTIRVSLRTQINSESFLKMVLLSIPIL